MSKRQRHTPKTLTLEILGWALIVVGLAALVLPGPGLLALFAGMAILATRYEWAEKRLKPVEAAALRTAAESVSSPLRLAISSLGILALLAIGIVWGIGPAVPGWWPLADKLWLVGGWGTGGTLIGSAVIAAAMLIYSYQHYRK